MKAARGPIRPPDDTDPAPAKGDPRKDVPASCRTARLERIRSRCEDGSYAVSSKQVADKIVKDAVARIRRRQK